MPVPGSLMNDELRLLRLTTRKKRALLNPHLSTSDNRCRHRLCRGRISSITLSRNNRLFVTAYVLRATAIQETD
jgi:hypothetical protein